MLVLEPFTEDHGRLMVQACAFPPVRLLAPRGSAAHRLAYMLDSLVRVSRRADRKPSASIQRAQLPKGSKSALMVPRSTGRHRLEANPALLPPRTIDADRHPAPVADNNADISPGAPPTSDPFPPQQFQALLTLFSKFFSSFPRGTCSLSVSRPYLALEGIYLPFRAAFPNNPTRRMGLVE